MSDAVRERIVVAAEKATVLAVITDVEAYPQWQDGIKEVTVLDRDVQRRATVARFTIDAQVLTASCVLAYEYADDVVRWHLVEGDGVDRVDGGYRLAERGPDHIEVTYELEVALRVRIPGFVRRRGAKRIVDGALRGLKRRVETLA